MLNSPLIYGDLNGNDVDPKIKFIGDTKGKETSLVWIYGAGNQIIYGLTEISAKPVINHTRAKL